MPKILLSEEQVAKLVLANKYPIDDKNKFISRCIDGRYPNEKNLPALAMPGADAGELAVILAMENIYGLQVDKEKAFDSLVEVVGGVKNLRFHTDSRAKKGVVCAGCGHMNQMKSGPRAFNLTEEDVEFILQKASSAKEKDAQEVVLQGEHEEGGVVTVRGPYGLYNQYPNDAGEGAATTQIFVFHDSLVNSRHRVLAEKLIAKKAVKKLAADDQDYLYSVLSETTENHLFEIAKRLAKSLPLYVVNFDLDGTFDLEFQGNV